MWVGIGVLILKTLWNFGVPYAMLHEAKVHPERKHGWSLFILLDIGCLLLALIASTFAAQSLVDVSTGTIALYGVVAIFASYFHLFIALFVAGFIKWCFSKKNQGDDLS